MCSHTIHRHEEVFSCVPYPSAIRSRPRNTSPEYRRNTPGIPAVRALRAAEPLALELAPAHPSTYPAAQAICEMDKRSTSAAPEAAAPHCRGPGERPMTIAGNPGTDAPDSPGEPDRLPPEGETTLANFTLYCGAGAACVAALVVIFSLDNGGALRLYYVGIVLGLVSTVAFVAYWFLPGQRRCSRPARARACAGCALGCLPVLAYVGFGIIFMIAMASPPPGPQAYAPEPITAEDMVGCWGARPARSMHYLELLDDGMGWHAVAPGGSIRV